MKYARLFILVLITLGYLGCEDTKKTPPEKTNSQLQKKQNTKTETTATHKEIDTESKKYPVLTSKNVVSFLTEYGSQNPETKVRISTQHGDIDIELYEDTPLHRANFIYLVKQEYFDGTFFHRAVPNFIIQGGNSDNRNIQKKRKTIGHDYLLPAELTSGRMHVYGTVSGAKQYRENPDKRTVPYEFFIFLGEPKDTGHLNGNYTIFAKISKGMDVVEKIANLPTDDGEWPLENVYIKATILE